MTQETITNNQAAMKAAIQKARVELIQHPENTYEILKNLTSKEYIVTEHISQRR